MSAREINEIDEENAIAIIGMAGRFPGARDLEMFWRNLKDGVCSITHFSEEQLLSTGVDPLLLQNPRYVKANGIVDDIDLFDASFFGYRPREAEILDPQHRAFLECAWEALEMAGYSCHRYQGLIGVYASVSLSGYVANILSNRSLARAVGGFPIFIANERDFLPLYTSYKLNLRGPSVNVQTACSSSLVTVHMACQSLLNGECDMALAGAVCIKVPHVAGYVFEEGGIGSPDGYCRAFDAEARGTVGGNGLGVVVLKRLQEALNDGDTIAAIIRGSAINNDGAIKVGFTAPSIEGQARVIAEALAVAGVQADTISYVEAHGTGTILGDPIELAALTQTFRMSTSETGYCALGSVKTNVGHLDTAAGMAGLIKTVLALQHQQIPPSLHFQQPNPQIDFASSPFFVNTTLTSWQSEGGPRRAGISSFGIGGTNAHIIVEEAPHVEASRPSRRSWHLFPLSARTPTALADMKARLAQHLCEHSELCLPDIAYTLQVGRVAFAHRCAVLVQQREEAITTLQGEVAGRIWQETLLDEVSPEVIFLFPGQGTQYVQMGRELYEQEPHFRILVERAAQWLRPLLGVDLRDVLYPQQKSQHEQAEAQLRQTRIGQPALFVLEYALASLLEEWGVQPQAMAGHSLGEYVAATLAGVMSWEEALTLVAARGRLMQQVPPGAMLAVALAEKDVRPFLSVHVSLAAINGARQCVVAGPLEEIEALRERWNGQKVGTRLLATSHAFHSQLVEPILEAYAQEVRQVKLQAPKRRYISNMTGTWITDAQATSVEYWVEHMRQTVQWSKGIETLRGVERQIFVEIGPGQTLGRFVRRQLQGMERVQVEATLGEEQDKLNASEMLQKVLGHMWLMGVTVDWKGGYKQEHRQRVPLPTYPFERRRYWIEPWKEETAPTTQVFLPAQPTGKISIPVWLQSPLLTTCGQKKREQQRWLLFVDRGDVGTYIAKKLEGMGHEVITIAAGEYDHHQGEKHYVVRPEQVDDYLFLLTEIDKLHKLSTKIVHLWNIDQQRQKISWNEDLQESQNLGFYGLFLLLHSLIEIVPQKLEHMWVVVSGVYEVTGEEVLLADRATLRGLCKNTYPGASSLIPRIIDIPSPISEAALGKRILDQLWLELINSPLDEVVAYRGKYRWVQHINPVQLVDVDNDQIVVKENDLYLFIGDIGDMSLALAECLTLYTSLKLIFIHYNAFPPYSNWKDLKTCENDIVRQKVHHLLRLETLGSLVRVIQVDENRKNSLKETISLVREQYGKIDGIIYAPQQIKNTELLYSNQNDQNRWIGYITKQKSQLLLLEEVVKGERIDTCILHSDISLQSRSNSSAELVIHSFIDVFVQNYNQQKKRPWFYINWTYGKIDQQEKESHISDRSQWLDFHEKKAKAKKLLNTIFSLMQLGMVIFPVEEIIQVSEFLQTRSTELASQALIPPPENAHAVMLASHLPPSMNEIEQRVIEIWRYMFSIENIGLRDNFFTLGGDSLLAVQITSRLADAFQIDLPLRALFERQTPAGLAEHIQTLRLSQQPSLPRLAIQVLQHERPIPLSFAQQRLWFLDYLEPGNSSYILSSVVRLVGKLNVVALQQSLQEIVNRHDSLRTTFDLFDEQPVQYIAPVLPVPFFLFDLQLLPNAQLEGEITRLVAWASEHPFDLKCGPLLRIVVLRESEERSVYVLAMHHIISDGWSLEVLNYELTTLYRAFSQGRPSPLPKLPIQYADYALWQRNWLQGEVLQEQVKYWKQQLADLPAVLALPTDRPRPAEQTYHGAIYRFEVSSGLFARLEAISHQEGVTLFMMLLMAFQILLYRYSGQTDIAVGVPIAGRSRVELESLIGFFVNTLVMRTKLERSLTAREVLHYVRQVALDAYAHQDLPFERLVDELQLTRDLSYNPLFQVMLSLENMPLPGERELLPELQIQTFESEHTTAKFDLFLAFHTATRGLVGTLEYNTDLFEKCTVQRMMMHFLVVLENIVADVTQPVGTLSLLTPVERQQILVEWSTSTLADAPCAISVQESFEKQVASMPDRIALHTESGQLSYAALHHWSNQVAMALQAAGVLPGSLVGLAMNRSAALVAGLLGIVKAGAGYVPLDPGYPPERLAYMVTDAQLSVVLAQKSFASLWSSDKVCVLSIEELEPLPAALTLSVPGEEAHHLDELLYVIYTSGSTGRPKGAGVYQRGFSNLLAWMVSEFSFKPEDRVLVFTSLSFDLTQKNILLPLVTGGTLHLAPQGLFDPDSLLQQLVTEQITYFNCTPSAFYPLIEEITCSAQLEDIRCVFLGGETVLSARLEKWQRMCHPGTLLVNSYGPTECTDLTTCYRVSEECMSLEEKAFLPIGRPLAQVEVYLLDRQEQSVPVGVVGEIYIGGVSVGMGYIHQAVLTAERFVPHPWSREPGQRLYRTGDLGRYREDGMIEFLGRMDQQVKVRGFRIELEEIEAVLGRQPQVCEGVVHVREDVGENKQLVAYVVSTEQKIDSQELRRSLARRLPDYMVPVLYVQLGQLPLTSSGKVDRQALPAPVEAHPTLESAAIVPPTKVESILLSIWQQVLGRTHIDIHDNFFSLGGDSILCIQVVARARQAGLHFNVKHLFQLQTVALLATQVQVSSLVNAEQGYISGYLPLTPIQCWFFAQQLHRFEHWNQALMLKMSEPLQARWLYACWWHLVQHHDMLRSRFVRSAQGWEAFIVEKETTLPLNWVDLTRLPVHKQQQEMLQWVNVIQSSLDLSQEPLWRGIVFLLGGQQPERLFLVMHHLIIDGISWRILLEDLQRIYEQLRHGEQIQLPSKTNSYRVWAERLAAYSRSKELQQELLYWLQVTGSVNTQLPLDYSNGMNTEENAETVNDLLNEEETLWLLQKVSQAYNTRINDVLLMALGRVLRQWTGQQLVLVDVEGHGREELFADCDTTRTVGWFTSIYPVRLKGEEREDIGREIKKVKEVLRDIPQHGIGYGVLCYSCEREDIKSKIQEMPQSEILFNYLGQFDQVLAEEQPFSFAQEAVGMLRHPQGLRSHVFEVNCVVTERKLLVRWTFSRNLHERRTVEKLTQDFIEQLRKIIEHCLSSDAGGFTPSDFPAAHLDQENLDDFLQFLETQMMGEETE